MPSCSDQAPCMSVRRSRRSLTAWFWPTSAVAQQVLAGLSRLIVSGEPVAVIGQSAANRGRLPAESEPLLERNRLGRLACASTLLVIGIAGAAHQARAQIRPPDLVRYLFSTFQPKTGAMHLLASRDLQHWSMVGASAVYEDPKGYAPGVHDPWIMRYRDGRFYVAYTTSAPDSFAITAATDLAAWSLTTRVPTGAIGVIRHTWSPEWFVDTDGSSIFSSVPIPPPPTSTFKSMRRIRSSRENLADAGQRR